MQAAVNLFLILTQNLLFHNLLGLPSIADAEKRGKGLLRTGLLVLLFCTVNAGLLALIRPLLPVRYEKLLFPLCCAVLNGLLDIILLLLCSLITKHLSKELAPQLHAATCSGAVLGALLMSTEYTHEVSVAFRYGFRMGIGFLAACIMLRLAAPVLCGKKMPACVRGWRAMYLYAGMIALAVACMQSV